MKRAIVLLNMGGPSDLDEVEVFLHNMFNDKYILTMKSDMLRAFVANRIISKRLNDAKENYKLIGGKSPLLGLTKELIAKFQDRVDDETLVLCAMRYTAPFAFDAIKEIIKQDIKEVYLIPLYPHYSTTTTLSSLNDFEEKLSKLQRKIVVKKLDKFYKNEKYNNAIISRIEEQIEGKKVENIDLIFSAHSLPQRLIELGDPYKQNVEDNVSILKGMLKDKGYNFRSISLAYQSKLGPIRWLGPALDSELKKYKKRNVLIYPISFIVDNSETDVELSIEYKELADECKIKNYSVCRCLNDSDLFVDALEEIYGKMQ